MEFGLKAKDRTTYVFTIQRVSILVLMEFGLKEEIVASQKLLMLGFNPCFNGIWFKSGILMVHLIWMNCFNPCFNGIWFKRIKVPKIPIADFTFQSLF